MYSIIKLSGSSGKALIYESEQWLFSAFFVPLMPRALDVAALAISKSRLSREIP